MEGEDKGHGAWRRGRTKEVSPRKAKVCELDISICRNKDVGRLEVTVQDSAGVASINAS